MGTNHGSTYGVTYPFGKVGQAFSFDDPDEGVWVPNASSLNPSNALTVEAWMYFTGSSEEGFVLGKDNRGTNRQYRLSLTTANKLRGYVNAGGTYTYVQSHATLSCDEWIHVAFTYSSAASNLSLYINGALDTNGLVTGAIPAKTTELVIGDHLYGLVDEPALYSRALSATEIQAIYNAGGAGKLSTNCVSPPSGIVGWWPGDGTTYDFARTNHGTLTNDALVNQAFWFGWDGGGGTLLVPDAPDLNPTTALSLEVWVYMTAETYDHRDIFSKDGESFDRQYLLTVSDIARFRAHVWTTNGLNYFDGTNEVQVETWYHVVMTYDGTELKLYVNGSLDSSSDSPSGDVVTTTQPVRLGGGEPYDEYNYYFPGLIDEATLYNRALSGSEVGALYAAGCAGKCRVDTDQDGLTDLQEAFLGINSNVADSDGDGLTDGDEVFVYHTNPNAADMDGDGLTDGAEVLIHGSNPTQAAVPDTNGVVNLKVFTPLK